ncbi:hypothetical protein [Rheinheimera sp. 4Y26]|uniref:hypothetical protein n=1 Tax=Rheinheimera sp. 4Y26 TaxID=2977811 RepID=UPI0021B13A47|nr:hypothetical protein [Rheinheimera sp. 4Y26]MCT6698145.1 hypothetical protein [Rheinheimera sp. 4Y26]
MNFLTTAVLVVGLSLWSVAAQATLIINGGFEANTVAKNNWKYFSATQVAGWEGSNIEIWHGLNGIKAAEGNQHAELNADGSNKGAWEIYQNFATEMGKTYDFSFMYRARANNKEAFLFSIGDIKTTVNNHSLGQWLKFSGSFTANSLLSTIRFTSLNSGTMGNFLDDVQVSAAPVQPQGVQVDEASTISVLALGLVLLALRRRRAA